MEKRNTRPNKTMRIHNVQVGVVDQNKEKKNHMSTTTKNPIFTLIDIKLIALIPCWDEEKMVQRGERR